MGQHKKTFQELKSIVYEKTNGHCGYCGKELEQNSMWHIEHMQPKSKRGSSNLDNLIPSCTTCNINKSNKNPQEFKALIIARTIRYIRNAMNNRLPNLLIYLSDEDEKRIIKSCSALLEEINRLDLKFYFEDNQHA